MEEELLKVQTDSAEFMGPWSLAEESGDHGSSAREEASRTVWASQLLRIKAQRDGMVSSRRTRAGIGDGTNQE